MLSTRTRTRGRTRGWESTWIRMLYVCESLVSFSSLPYKRVVLGMRDVGYI